MTKNELKQLVKEVLAEQNALTTLQISTVGGGTTLLLYRGDARQTERSSNKAYKTPTQFGNLIASLNTTGGMTTDEAIKNILKKLTPEQLKQLVREKITVSDRVSEFLGEEASTKELQKLGFKPTKSDVNEESDSTKEKAKLAYSNLKKREFEYRELTKKTKDPVKKQRFSDMAEKVKKEASDILRYFFDNVEDFFYESVNESPIVRGLIRPDPKSPLEGAVVKRVEGHGHYHADMILLTKNNKEIKGRFEFDPHNPPSFYESVNEAGGPIWRKLTAADYEILKDPVNDIAKKIKTIISNNPLYKNVSVNYLTTDSEDKIGLAVLRGGKAAVDAKLSDGNGSVFVSIDSPTRIRVTVKKNSGSGITYKFTNVDDVIAFLKNTPSLNEDGKMNEVKGFVLNFNTPEADYMRKNGVMKPKMNSAFKKMMNTRTVKYADLLKAFPQSTNIVLKDLPSIPKLNTGSVDYYTVDSEGDVVPLSQGDIGSGLD